MESEWVDFKEIKSAVSLMMVLAHYNVQLRRVNRESLRGACPLPMHSSKGEQNFCVNITKNIWSCQSSSCVKARQGKKGGNVLDFVALIEGCSIRDAALKLQNWFSVGNGVPTTVEEKKPARSNAEVVPKKEMRSDSPEKNQPLQFTLKDVNPTHPYLAKRGITEDTARTFGVGFFPGRGSMAGRIVIPLHDREGRLIAYAGRSIDTTEPKYKLPAGFHKSIELFNVWRAVNPILETLVIVEGFFDCMKVHQSGHSSVVAVMGCALSEHQENVLLNIPFRKIILMLDGDEAGRGAAKEIAARLIERAFVKIVDIPDGQQPDQLSSGELKQLLASI